MISISRKTQLGLPFNPKGIASSSPGLRGTSYPGKTARQPVNPNGVVSITPPRGHNPVGVENIFGSVTQGSSFLATLGFAPESRWDSKAGSHTVEANS